MRTKRRRVADVEEGESYYVSMTDMMVGVIFIFIIMLSYFALEFRSTTTALTKAKHPETAALLQTATNLQPRKADLEIDYKARVLCVPETVLSADEAGSATEKRCFGFGPVVKQTAPAASDAQRQMMMFIDADLHDANAPTVGDTSGGSLTFRAETLFLNGSADLSPEGRRIAGEVAQTLVRRLACLAYGAGVNANCSPTDPKLAMVNVVSQTNLDAFTPEGQRAASLALQRSAAFHQALTAAQPQLGALRNAPPGQPGSQPLLRVASLGQSQEGASRAGDDQTISIQFQMAP